MLNAYLKNIKRPLKHALAQRSILRISRRVLKSNLTYLSHKKLVNLEKCIKEVTDNRIPGIFMEAGIALGGSTIIIASLMPKDTAFHGFDLFGRIPPPSDKDDEKAKNRYKIIKEGKSKGINGNTYYGYENNLYRTVVRNLELFDLHVDGKKIALHPGLFAETMTFENDTKIALAHIDCDWYESVRTCLNRIYPSWSIGGYIVIDDYNDYAGCKRAADEFLSNKSDVVVIKNDGNLILKRLLP